VTAAFYSLGAMRGCLVADERGVLTDFNGGH
jgi:hypothetical protein